MGFQQAQQNVTQPANANSAPSETGIPPELVKKVTDKVYALLLFELTIEGERAGKTAPNIYRRHGGR